MPITTAEKNRRYREKLKEDPEKREAQRLKNLIRIQKKRKKVSELSNTEKEKQRKKWREAKKRKQKLNTETPKKKVESEKVGSEENYVYYKRKYNILRRKINEMEVFTHKILKNNTSLRKQVWRLKRKNACLMKNERDAENVQENVLDINVDAEMTPITKTNKFVEENLGNVTPEKKQRVARQILVSNVMFESLKKTYKVCTLNKDKSILKKTVTNALVKRYKMKTCLGKKIGLEGKVRQQSRQKKKSPIISHIQTFYLRDDVSRCTAGKKECKTLKKEKTQIRYLKDSLQNLHVKYRTEGGKASLKTFARYRPFYVLRPNEKNRDTCLCKKHANTQFLANALKNLNIINTNDLRELLEKVSCDTKNIDCMNNNCRVCKSKKVGVSLDHTSTENDVTWIRSRQKDHEFIKTLKNGRNTAVRTKKTMKEIQHGNVADLISLFDSEIIILKKHNFNIYHQHKQYMSCIDNLSANEAVIHCDFSENYTCKMAEEVQSSHFGASKSQITLHTGVVYLATRKPTSFCTVSSCNDHNPGAIWAHLKPIIDYLRSENPEINILHYFSDGPCTQYRQKKNFYLFHKYTQELGMKHATWSFFEAGHGKGAADGVGGAVKRALDQNVAYGNDIPNATVAVAILKRSMKTVRVFDVPEEEIKNVQEKIPNDIQRLVGTMMLHQIISCGDDFFYRNLSCFCEQMKGLCQCFSLKSHPIDSTCTTRKIKLAPTEMLNQSPSTSVETVEVIHLPILEPSTAPTDSLDSQPQPSTST